MAKKKSVGLSMKLTPPTKTVFSLGSLLVILGIVSHFIAIPIVGAYEFWYLAIGGVLLIMGCLFKGL